MKMEAICAMYNILLCGQIKVPCCGTYIPGYITGSFFHLLVIPWMFVISLLKLIKTSLLNVLMSIE